MSLVTFAVAALFLAGCCSSPKPKFYTLSPQAPAAATAPAAAPTGRPSVGVAAVTLPDSVDRPQLVTRTGANEVAIAEQHRWAGPLKAEVPRVLAENIARLTGNPQVSAHPAAAAASADYRVVTDFQRFEGTVGGDVVLEALWMVQTTGGDLVTAGRSAVREPTGAAGYEALTAAYSRALARLAGFIAPAVKDLPAPKR
ncbi:MAG TPA: PqiC family protein [Pelomicrobium sp.]|nr:PqiC family protein [Pelomicrobium sp.]